jgi:Kelch motif
MAMTYDTVDTAYFLGGYTTCRSDPKILDCGAQKVLGPMIAYNAASNTWTNNSAAGLTSWPNALLLSTMESVPFGSPKSLNVIFSGYSSDTISDSSPYLGLDTVYIHDPVTNIFWNQTATSASGNIPQPRVRACSVGIQGTNGTFEIFVFGGNDLSRSMKDNILISDAVWVLSLPSFVWFRADYPPQVVRYAHTCTIAPQANSQIIVWGGVDIREVRANNADPWTNGINVFDMNTMAWKSEYNAKAPMYKTPSIITDYLRGNDPLPQSWNYPDVQHLFSQVPTSGSSSSPPSSPSPSATASPSSGPKSRASPIAGGVVGGLVGLAFLALLGWFLLRRRRKQARRGPGAPPYEKPELPNSERANHINGDRDHHSHPPTEIQHYDRHEADATTGAVNEMDSDMNMNTRDGIGAEERWELPGRTADS